MTFMTHAFINENNFARAKLQWEHTFLATLLNASGLNNNF